MPSSCVSRLWSGDKLAPGTGCGWVSARPTLRRARHNGQPRSIAVLIIESFARRVWSNYWVWLCPAVCGTFSCSVLLGKRAPTCGSSVSPPRGRPKLTQMARKPQTPSSGGSPGCRLKTKACLPLVLHSSLWTIVTWPTACVGEIGR